MSAKEKLKKEIIEAYIFLRTNNMTIPSETLELMKDASLKELEKQFVITDVVSCFTCKFNNNDGKKEPICCHCSGNLDMHEPK